MSRLLPNDLEWMADNGMSPGGSAVMICARTFGRVRLWSLVPRPRFVVFLL